MESRRINVRAIIWRDGTLLAVKHKNSDGSESPYWAVPGGGLDPAESLTDGVRREIFEETGIAADVGKLLFMQQFRSGRKGFTEELEFFYHISNPEAFTSIDLSKTSHGLEEIARIEFIDPKVEHILPSLLSDVDIASYIDSDKPVLLHDEL